MPLLDMHDTGGLGRAPAGHARHTGVSSRHESIGIPLYYHKHNSISRIITQVKEMRCMHLVMAGGRHQAAFSKATL